VIYIEHEGSLYLGHSRSWPVEIWSQRQRRWLPYHGRTPKPIEWGTIVDEAEARRVMGEPDGEADAPAATFLQVSAKHPFVMRLASGAAPAFFNRKTLRWHPWPGPIPPCARPISKADVWRDMRHEMLGLDFGTVDRPWREWPIWPSRP